MDTIIIRIKCIRIYVSHEYVFYPEVRTIYSNCKAKVELRMCIYTYSKPMGYMIASYITEEFACKGVNARHFEPLNTLSWLCYSLVL